MVKGQELFSGHLDIPRQLSGKGKGTGTDPEARTDLMIAHWEAFANRLLRKLARKHMFKTMRVERRRRAMIMRENVARRTLIHANPNMNLLGQLLSMKTPRVTMSELVQLLLQRVMHQLLHLDGYLPPPVVGRALDVLNAPSSIREEFQAAFNSRTFGQIQQKKKAKELHKSLIDPAGRRTLHCQGGYTNCEEIPRTTLAGLEATNLQKRPKWCLFVLSRSFSGFESCRVSINMILRSAMALGRKFLQVSGLLTPLWSLGGKQCLTLAVTIIRSGHFWSRLANGPLGSHV